MLSRLIVLIAVCVSASLGYAQNLCQTQLQEAEKKYHEGRLNDAIDLAVRCLGTTGLTQEESELAYKILGKAYLAKELVSEAKEVIKRLLNLIPAWKPDPEQDPPAFRALVEEVIKELEKWRLETPPLQPAPDSLRTAPPAQPPQPRPPSKKWLWLGGGGAVAVGAVAFAVLNKKESGEERLPNPPPLPSRP